MDPVSSTALEALGNQAAEVAIREAESFLTKALGEPGEAVGSWFATKMRARLYNNLISIVAEANRKSKEAGLKPGAIPLKIIHPMLESAALEEEPELQEMWANLLANAADSESENPVRPIYVTILKELKSGEARFVNALYDYASQRISAAVRFYPELQLTVGFKTPHRLPLSNLSEIAEKVGLIEAPPKDFSITSKQRHELLVVRQNRLMRSLDVLLRQRLLHQTGDPAPVKLGAQDQAFNTEQTLNIAMDETYELTQLAVDFVQACRTPKPHRESN